MNSVNLICVIQPPIDDVYREVEYLLPCFNDDGKNSQKLICKYWPGSPKSRFMQIKDGTRVVLCGHLDAHEKFGTILVVEQFEVLN